MEALSKINLPELAQPNNGESTISLLSHRSLPEGTGLALSQMLGQAMARFPNQQLAELTQEMYLTEWEEMAEKFGLATFRDALLRAIREGEFFPSPNTIRQYCDGIRSKNRMRDDAQKAIREHDAAKAKWESERSEAKG